MLLPPARAQWDLLLSTGDEGSETQPPPGPLARYPQSSNFLGFGPLRSWADS